MALTEATTFEEAKELDDKYVMHTFGRKPVMLVEGKGMTVKDDKGNEYLDFISGIGVDSLGHCHPAVVEAIKEQAEKLIHVSNYYYIEKRGEVAKMISAMANEDVPKFYRAPWLTFFANSGAEANECAIKLARAYSKRYSTGGQTIIVLTNSFHGRTLATLAATAQPAKQELFQPLPAGFVAVPMNDMAALKKAFADADGMVAAVMVECIQGEGGVRPCDEDYLCEVMQYARQFNALVISDEVQTGVYRTGKPFAFQNFGFTPDIFTMAKGIASGFPMGACVARVEVAEAFQPGDHGSTFGGSNLAVAAAHATLSTLMKEPFVKEIDELGCYFADKLAALDDIHEVRGMGLMVGADVSEDIDANVVVLEGLKKGFLLNATSKGTLRFLPPLICTKKEIDAVVDALPGLFADARATQAADAAEAAQADPAKAEAEAMAAELKNMLG